MPITVVVPMTGIGISIDGIAGAGAIGAAPPPFGNPTTVVNPTVDSGAGSSTAGNDGDCGAGVVDVDATGIGRGSFADALASAAGASDPSSVVAGIFVGFVVIDPEATL